ncbi:MAG: 3-methyl-2-oxobutanoate hydroxymethyltransferase [Chloroherpetonaceae bacterium]|nr:3-methyl-2-oxobutanoate hydroxymethyltransferase [Chloroherpetonaceae bacterium]
MSTRLGKHIDIHASTRQVTTRQVVEMKQRGERISMLTAYDFTLARILDTAGIDIILVGDSASNVFCGNETTLPITIDEMIYHAKAVLKGIQSAQNRAMVVVDMPFMSYQLSSEDALKNAGRIMKETGCHAVKLEGGKSVVETVQRITDAGIPVMGHLGLTPQSIYKFGSYKVRAKEEKEAQEILESSKLLEHAGAFSIVLEKIPASLAESVTKQLQIPTIGIGAGSGCDGQVLVTNDLLGLNNEFNPRFVRRYANLEEVISNAVQSYLEDVKSGVFPSTNESYL